MNVPLYGDEFRKLYNNMATLFPSAQDAPNMTIKVSAGGFWIYSINGAAYIEYTGGSSPTIRAPQSQAKWVAVCLASGGSLVIVDGAAAAHPVLPTIPKNRYPIALVYVNSGTTKLTNDIIFDARPIFSIPVRAHSDLEGITAADCHQISSISNLTDTLAAMPTITGMEEALALKADAGGTNDVVFTLNKDLTGTPSSDGFLEIERGSETNVAIRWNESSDVWQYTNDGATWVPLGLGIGYPNDGSTEIILKLYQGGTIPTLTDGQAAMWWNSGGNGKVYFTFKPPGAAQVKVELT